MDDEWMRGITRNQCAAQEWTASKANEWERWSPKKYRDIMAMN